jgi:hypothetical protein
LSKLKNTNGMMNQISCSPIEDNYRILLHTYSSGPDPNTGPNPDPHLVSSIPPHILFERTNPNQRGQTIPK